MGNINQARGELLDLMPVSILFHGTLIQIEEGIDANLIMDVFSLKVGLKEPAGPALAAADKTLIKGSG